MCMKSAPHEGGVIDLRKQPDGSFGTRVIEENPHAEDLRNRFENVLKPKSENEEAASNVAYHDFSSVKQPTNLDIEPEDKPPISTIEAGSRGMWDEKDEAKEESEKAFEIPKGFRTYVMDLKAQGRKTSVLEWDMDPPFSKDRIISSLKRSLALNELNEAEYEKAMVKLEAMSEKSSMPSSVDISMRATDKYVEKKEAEAEIAPDVAPEVVPEVVPTPEVSVESIEQKLDDARQNFVEQKIKRDKKIEENRRAFKKLISGLGLSRDLPEQEDSVDWVEARDAYIGAKKEKYKPLLEKSIVEMRPVEGQMLNLKEIGYSVNTALAEEIEKEQEKLSAALEAHLTDGQREMILAGLEKFNKFSRSARLVVSDMLASEVGSIFGKRIGEAVKAYSGYRTDKVLSKIAQKVDGIQKKNIDSIHADAVEELKTNVDMDNLLEREQNFLKVLDKEKNLKKRQSLISAGINAVTGNGNENEETAPAGPESVESTSLVFNGEEIAHEKDGILVLDDKFQDGSEYKEARMAFSKAFDEKYKESFLGITPIAIQFEEGRIYVIRESGDKAGMMRVFLNGKEIAEGKEVRKLKLLKGIKTGWVLKTVYEKALQEAVLKMRNLK